MSSFVDTYFAGDYNAYRAYFSGKTVYDFHYVMNYIPEPIGVINSGGKNTTDWVDSNGDGVADGYFLNVLTGDADGEIVTNVGFNGNAQQVEVTEDEETDVSLLRFVGELDVAETYRIRFRYRCSTQGIIVSIGSLDVSIPGLVNEVTEYTSDEFTITGTTELLSISMPDTALIDDYFQIDAIELLRPEEQLILKVNPGGWDKLRIKYDRSTFYNSVLRSYVGSLQFPRREEGGGLFIVDKFNRGGINANVTIEIYERNSNTNDFDLTYQGEIEYRAGKYFDKVSDNLVEVSVLDGSKESKIVDRDDIDYDLFSIESHENNLVKAIDANSISLPPIDIYLLLNYDGVLYSYFTIYPSTNESPYSIYFNPSGNPNVNEWGDRFIANSENFELYENANETSTDITITSFTTNSNIASVITYNDAGVVGTADISFQCSVLVYDSEGVEVSSTIIFLFTQSFNSPEESSGTETTIVNFDFSLLNDLTVSVPEGGKILIGQIVSVTNFAGYILTYLENIAFNFQATEKYPSIGTTTAEGYYLHEAFTKQIQLITGEQDTDKIFQSNLLGRIDSEFIDYSVNGLWSELFLTSGWQLRKFTEKAMLSSLSDLFQTMYAINPIGLGYDRVNDIFFLEDIEQFYKEDYFMFNLDGVSDLSIEIDGDAYFNSIKSGWANIINEDVNGANEFNSPMTHTINKPIKKSYQARAVYNGSSITIELTRRKQYDTNASEDTKGDEERFIIYTKQGVASQGGYSVSNPEGIINIDEYYNLDITGRENLLRHGKVINIINRQDPQQVRFGSLKNATDISYTNSQGNSVTEKSNIQPDELNGQLHIPVVYKFNYPVNNSIIQTMNTDPHGYFTFNIGNDATKYYAKIKTLEVEAYPDLAEWICSGVLLVDELNAIFEDERNIVFEDDRNEIFE